MFLVSRQLHVNARYMKAHPFFRVRTPCWCFADFALVLL